MRWYRWIFWEFSEFSKFLPKAMGGYPILLWANRTAEMSDLDPHLEKTSEKFKIGWVEKKLQPLKVGNKSEKITRFYQNMKGILDFLFKLMTSEEFKYQNVTQFCIFFDFCVIFSYIRFDSRDFIFDAHDVYDISCASK